MSVTIELTGIINVFDKDETKLCLALAEMIGIQAIPYYCQSNYLTQIFIPASGSNLGWPTYLEHLEKLKQLVYEIKLRTGIRVLVMQTGELGTGIIDLLENPEIGEIK